MIKYILTVDPGTRNAGWSFFNILEDQKQAVLSASGCVRVPAKTKDWIARIDTIVHEISMLIRKKDPSMKQPFILIVELPMNFGSSKGMAASNSGSVGKLMGCVFQLKGTVMNLFESCTEVKLVPVRTWKGNTPKSITQKRILKHWNAVGSTEDESDAIGIGDYWVRNVLKYKPKRKELK